jgi:protocatechuate 3,4-dioxygenase beta subunit
MRLNIRFIILTLLVGSISGCTSQDIQKTSILSNDFDESPPFYYNIPESIVAIDTSPGWKQDGTKILLTGTVYQNDGTTPVPELLLYYYHTDMKGTYSIKENEKRNMPKNELGQTHGYIRGWIKTDAQGRYYLYTVMPASYPNRKEPAHVHMTIKDPDLEDPYYIDDFVFDNDPILNAKRRKNMENRGGSGVIRFVEKENLLIGERNIFLGLNIPDYPQKKSTSLHSGRNIGEDIISFTPFHAYGPDKGTKTCPICKYGWYHGILLFVGSNPDWDEIKDWLVFLDNESVKREKYLKAYFVYGNEGAYDKNKRISELEMLGNELGLKKVALTFVPSFFDQESEIYFNKINPEVDNTIILYKRSNIIAKHIALKPTQKNLMMIRNELAQTINEYFDLPGVKTDDIIKR